VDDNSVELALARVFQKLAEDGTAGDGIDVGRLALFAIDPDDFPSPILAELPEESFLGVKGMPPVCLPSVARCSSPFLICVPRAPL